MDTGTYQVIAQGLSNTLYGVDVAPDGTVFAVDGQVLRRLAPGATTTTVVATFDFVADNLVLDDRTGTVYVSSITTAEIVAVAPNGGVRGVSPGGVLLPQGLAVDRTRDRQQLLISQISTIIGVDPRTGRIRRSVASAVPNTVQSVSATRGRWVSASPIGGIVTLFDPKAGTSSVAAGGLDYPLDAVLNDDSLLVAEAGTGRLLRIPLADPASRVVVADGLGAPAGMATRGDTTWVTDAAGGRVFQISRTGQVRLVATGLARPQGIAVRGGELVVVESGTGRVTALKLGSQRRRTLLHGLTPANPPLPGRPTDGIYFGVAVNTAGTVFVSDPFTNRVLSVRHR